MSFRNLSSILPTFTRRRFFSRYSAAHMMAKTEVFRISDYDCVGFDLDNTLVQYKIAAMVEMEYETLSNFLINNKEYPRKALEKAIDMDFLQKGLIIDFDNGNLLKLNAGGVIGKASHGTKFLSDEEIVEIYGPNRRWKITDEYVENMLATWNGPLADRMRTLLDYFDMSVSLIFARMVDYIDANYEKDKREYNIWSDILEGLRFMYERENFNIDQGVYFPKMKTNPAEYIHQASPELLNWLKELKNIKSTFLITGSHIDFANLTATTALGPDWRSYFDFIGVFAKKPGFFTGGKPFVQLDGIHEISSLKQSELKTNEVYSQGNWRDMIHLLTLHVKKNNPKCLYFGDNLLQDIYAPAKYTKCDTIAVVEEMLGEGMKGYNELHQDCVLLQSSLWGSYFSTNGVPTIWADVIEKYAKICVPSVETLAKYSLDHDFYTFTETEHSKGYYPEDPVHIVKKVIK